MNFRSPQTGAALHRHGHALCADGERWPIVDGIAYLRTNREALADAALACLDSGDETGALLLLLGDQDDWAKTSPPSIEARRDLLRLRDELTFRDAMDLLALGPVATYFAHRWSDPTFLSGLALAQAYFDSVAESWRVPVFELACGAGHFLRVFGREAVGADVVFAKLWLARHFVAPEAGLICFDAASLWPLADGMSATVFCHDAYYFMSRKPHVASEMMRVGRRVLIGHVHNAMTDNLSAGEPLTPQEYADLFPGAVLFDDAELTRALLEETVPRHASADALADAAALALAWPGTQPGGASGHLSAIQPGTMLCRNPLYHNGRIRWPSERYAQEYGPLASYPDATDAPETAVYGSDPAIDNLAHRRVFLDLPQRW